MSELLLELLTEEIPARMQARAAADLKRLVMERLGAAQLAPTTITSLVTPRRLVLVVEGLPAAQPDVSEERRGPREGAPQQAIEGFERSSGVPAAKWRLAQSGKVTYWYADISRPGRSLEEVLPELLKAAILELPWAKSMRFPAAPFRWVRPLASVVSLLDGKVLPLELGAVPVGDTTRGHRFLAPGEITVASFRDYAEKLAAAKVVLDPAVRRERIAAGLAAAADADGLRVKEDVGLLDEVTGLVELPVVLAGTIRPEFMALPPEVLTTSMRSHQKYFATLDGKGALAPRFLVVANTEAADGGAAIVAGNERVLKARLSDARFFWDQDRKERLESRVPKLGERTFYEGLGTVLDKVRRIEALAAAIARYVPGADAGLARRAAGLAKADLSTGMVGEFPELQGVMGRYYALHDGEPPVVADAVAEHYAPQGPGDSCPTAPVSVAVALADKLDTLAAFFAIGEKPTGSKDPFALRRAALGVIRLVIENRLRLPLEAVLAEAHAVLARSGALGIATADPVVRDLLGFFADRLKVHLREEGVRHDLIAAVFALGGEDDLVRLLARVAALAEFLDAEDGANLLVAYRRAANIVRIEEKKDGVSYDGAPDPALLETAEEKALAERLSEVERLAAAALRDEAFGVAMGALARLRAPVDEFFTRVTVNSPDQGLRANRLRLLQRIRATLNRVADFSQIEG